MPENTINFPITITLSQDQAARLVSSKQDASEVATALVGEYSKGGIMVSAQDTAYMFRVLQSSPAFLERHAGEIVENAVDRKSYDGSLVVSYRLDPAFAQPLEELSRAQGRTVDAIVQEAISIVITNQWLYSIECSGGTLYFNREKREELEHLVGGEVKGGDWLVGWMKENLPMKPLPILESESEVRP